MNHFVKPAHVALVLLAGFAPFVWAQAPAGPPAPTNAPQPPVRRGGGGAGLDYKNYDEATLERGKKIYTANCAFCHGGNAKGGESWPGLIALHYSAARRKWRLDQQSCFEWRVQTRACPSSTFRPTKLPISSRSSTMACAQPHSAAPTKFSIFWSATRKQVKPILMALVTAPLAIPSRETWRTSDPNMIR